MPAAFTVYVVAVVGMGTAVFRRRSICHGSLMKLFWFGCSHQYRLYCVYTDRIIGDTWSLDTIGNAYFVVAMICDPLRLQNVIVVTSQFHMERTKVIFEWLFPLWMPTGTLGFAASRDRGLDTATLALRNAKEAASVKSLKVLTEQHRDKLSVAQFVMLKHSAYVAYVRTGLLFTVDSVCEDCHTWPCNWL
eukprot:m.484593 g.484593  ORF g.484593 m.484593 type:complete len:191 (-) comp21731_c3_seq24:3380-3952(-)